MTSTIFILILIISNSHIHNPCELAAIDVDGELAALEVGRIIESQELTVKEAQEHIKVG